jgi:hypothetical protein
MNNKPVVTKGSILMVDLGPPQSTRSSEAPDNLNYGMPNKPVPSQVNRVSN